MSEALHKDPTFDKVVAMEVREKGCRACQRSIEVIPGAYRCGVGKSFPKCRGQRNGFLLDGGEG